MSVTRESFEFVRKVLLERSARSLEDEKVYLVETRLLPVARRHGFQSVEDLVLHLRKRPTETLMGELVQAMTINETFFFRDASPFDVLRQNVLPDLMSRRAVSRCLNIWSAACSSGQEAYSLAILLRHDFPELASWNIRLIASDLSTAMLERARLGLYTELEVSRGLPAALRDSYFHRHEGGWRIRQDLRRMIEIRAINLSGAWPELPALDLVLLRNVLIYLGLPAKQWILQQVRRVLQPDGYLLLGAAETTLNVSDEFVQLPFDQASLFQVTK